MITSSWLSVHLYRPVNQNRSPARRDRQPQTSHASFLLRLRTHPTLERRAFTTAFKLGVLSYATNGRVDDGKGGLRAPRAKEVCVRYNLKHTRYLHRWWQEEEILLLMKPLQKRHRPSRGRWPKLEKALVQAFADRRKEGKTVRKKWFERTAKALFLQLYPASPTIFVVSNGWFNQLLSRNEISIRVVTNKAQQTPTEYCAMIVSFLCFNRRNSQLRDGMEDTALRSAIAVGCYLLSHILNMDQTPLPWDYLEGKTYEFKGVRQCGYVHGDQGGISGKQQYSSRFLPTVSIASCPSLSFAAPKTTPPPLGDGKKNIRLSSGS